MNHDDDLGQALWGALHREAEHIDAAPGDFQRLQQRIAGERGGLRPAAWMPWLATAAAVAAVIGVSGVWLAGRPDPSNSTSPPAGSVSQVPETTRTPGTTAGPRPSPGPTAVQPLVVASAGTRALPVYWVAPGDRPGFVLFREFYTVPVVGAQQAVDAMLTGHPVDPDYSSPWRPADARVDITRDAILVDLDVEAFANTSVGGDLARAGVQQLVYTVTAAAQLERPGAGALPVRILVDGRPGATAWGSVSLAKPLRRDPAAQAGLWIISPVEGAKLKAGKVTVTAYGTAFEANALWVVYRVVGGKEQQVADSYVMVGGGGTRAEGRFTVNLKAGEYRIRVYEPDASGGEAPVNPDVAPDQTGDDKTVLVR